MVIYMSHEKHGSKVACSEEEAKYDETKGWKRYKPDGATVTVAEPSTAAAVVVEEKESREALAKQYQERFGKKPHHKKSVATLKSELAA